MKPSKKVHTKEKEADSGRIDAEIDHILATDDELIPSSGFMAAVMERVEQEAAAPQPIPFPWKRAIPGIVLTVGVFGWGVVEVIQSGLPALRSFTLATPQLSAAFAGPVESAGWVALALGVSLCSWLLSRSLAGRGGLL